MNDTVSPRASKGYWLPSIAGLGTSWVGAVKVESDRNIVTIGRPHIGSQVLTYNGGSTGGSLLDMCQCCSRMRLVEAMIDLLAWVQHLETITSDNGKEFAAHQLISRELLVDFYFAHPYASWERGTNENMNGLIHQYLPKERDLTTVTAQEEIMIMDRLNLRPRKCLDFNTPFEVFFALIPVALTT